MPTRQDHIETVNTADQAHVAHIHDAHDGGKLIENSNKQIDKLVEDHIKRGDYVAPPNQPSPAEALDKAVELATGPGFTMSVDEGFISYGGMDTYAARSRVATRDIDRKEEKIASEHWQALSPAERKTIEQEKLALEQYHMLAIYRNPNDHPPATPHLDSYTKGVEHAIAPLEKERATTVHKVWNELPVENKAAIFREQEERKRFR